MNKHTNSPATLLSASAPWLLMLWMLLLLMVLQPYAAGYGSVRQTLFETLAMRWKDQTWQHGALAFPIAAWLLWLRRVEFAALPARWNLAGLFAVMAGLLLYFVGYRANFYYFGAAAIQLIIGGTVLWVHGWQRFKVCFFPWLMLCFAWPIVFLEDSVLLLKLRMMMVNCAATVMSFVGVPTLTDGTTLVSAATNAHEAGGLFRFNVDGPCSGLRSVFALMMVSALFGYFRQRQLWRRLVLFAASIPLAIVANMVRIFILLGGSMLFGQDFAVGNHEKEVSTFHFLAGIAVFVVALVGLQALSWVITRIFDGDRSTVRTRRVGAVQPSNQELPAT
jgi:exosortase